VGASLAAHAIFAAALVVVPMLRPRPPLIPVDATVVELAGPLPTPSRGGSSALAAPTPPKPEPKAPEKSVAKPPAPEKLVLAKPSKKKEPERKKHPEPAEGTEGPPSAAPTPSPNAGGTGTGVTALEGGGVPGAGWYNAAVTSALQGSWVKPVLDASDQVYSVVVAFEIGRDGNVFNLAVDVPSGVAALDRSALRAVTDAAPFPAPPASAGGSIRQRVRFELSPE
jgi:protein TonB